MLCAVCCVLQVRSSDLAHDMKNPLNGVLSLTQNVVQGSFGELPPTVHNQLHVVCACGHHLLNMLNMSRDMLRALAGGDIDLGMGRVQVATPTAEVCGCQASGNPEASLHPSSSPRAVWLHIGACCICSAVVFTWT